MNKLVLKSFQFILVPLIPLSTFGQDTGIVFNQLLLSDAFKRAQKQKKMVFVDCYAKWCGPCKMLSKDVFTQKEVGNYFNENFICLEYDMEREGKDIRNKYEVKSYPTLLFLNDKGEVMERIVGYRNSKELIDMARKARDPDRNIPALNLRYQRGEISYDIIENQLRNSRDDLKEKLLDKYFMPKYVSEWTDKQSWELIHTHASITSRYFNYLLDNEPLFDSIYGKKKVEQVILNKFSDYYRKKKTQSEKLDAVGYLKSFNHPLGVKAVLVVEQSNAIHDISIDPYQKKAWIDFLRATETLINVFGDEERSGLRNLARFINSRKWKIHKISEQINATNNSLGKLTCQYLKLFQAIEILKDSTLSKKKISTVLQSADDILVNRLVGFKELNNLAWKMLIHKKREQFLNKAQKLSFLTLDEKKYYHYGTYGAICAQLNNFEEAIKYEEIALQLAKEYHPKSVQYYVDSIEKFKNRIPLY